MFWSVVEGVHRETADNFMAETGKVVNKKGKLLKKL